VIPGAAAILGQPGIEAVDGEGCRFCIELGNEMIETAAGEFGMEKGWAAERV